MNEDKFDILFRGDIVMGHTLVDVKQRLAQLFKIDADKVDALFVGKAVPLKRNLDRDTAEKYKAALIKAGAQVSISAAGGEKPAVKPRPKPQPTQAPVPVVAKKLSLKERLEQQASAESAQAAAAPVKPKAEPLASKPLPSQSQPLKSHVAIDTSGLTLAAVGSRMGEEKQQTVVNIDVSDISIKAMEGDLLEASEKAKPVVNNIDVSGIDVAEAGADLLTESERAKPPVADLPDLDFDIAEVGADLLDTSDRLPLPEIEIDFSQFDLAPVGSDMNQAKKSDPPPPPDTSALSLAD